MTDFRRVLLLAAVLFVSAPAFAQYYNPVAAENAPKVHRMERVRDDRTGELITREVITDAPKDTHGNAQGNQFDLAVDGAFKGETIVVLQFYTLENFDFSLPKAAVAQKGFSVVRYHGGAPAPEKLKEDLTKASQLWIIGTSDQRLNEKHVQVIKDFFDAGHGLYLWGDNEPYYVDTNLVAKAVLGVTMSGNLMGDQIVPVQDGKAHKGVLRGHLLTTGLEHLYEGITIATLAPNDNLKPLVYGSAGNLVAAVYERDGKRAILDGGFTRLYIKWDTAGTARYIKNAAAWLANAERFGEKPVSEKKEPAKKKPLAKKAGAPVSGQP